MGLEHAKFVETYLSMLLLLVGNVQGAVDRPEQVDSIIPLCGAEFEVVPYSTIGTRLMANGTFQKGLGAPLSLDMVIVDATDLWTLQKHQIYQKSGSLYDLIGLYLFPNAVSSALQQVADAKLQTYALQGENHDVSVNVIHAVGPDLWSPEFLNNEANVRKTLTKTYTNVLREFANSGLKTLRILPISAGIYSGPYEVHMPRFTFEAFKLGAMGLDIEQKQKMMEARIEMCIPMESQLQMYRRQAWRVLSTLQCSRWFTGSSSGVNHTRLETGGTKNAVSWI